jgi:hypothetical protein
MNLIGQKFNRLLVVGKAEKYIASSGQKQNQWLCKCNCGKEVVVTTAHLKSGHTKSCGCYAKEVSIQNGLKKKHGLIKIRIYRIWSAIKTRCFNPKDEHFKDYGNRGITVCEEWQNSFQAFYDYVSQLPHFNEKGYSLDRINNDGNYEPNNVRWATATQQNYNQRRTVRVAFNGEIHTLKEWYEITGIPLYTLKYRYYSGKNPNEILGRKKMKNGIAS